MPFGKVTESFPPLKIFEASKKAAHIEKYISRKYFLVLWQSVSTSGRSESLELIFVERGDAPGC